LQYPSINVYLNKLTQNVSLAKKICDAHEIEIIGVTKGFCGHPGIAEAYVKGGVSGLADSRIKNLKKLGCFNVPRYLLRIPMLSEAADVVKYADVSLNSELETIRTLGREAVLQSKRHKIILMLELGDIREGVLIEDVLDYVQAISEIKGIKLVGIGANLSCFGGVIPDENNLGLLAQKAEQIENKFKIKLEIVSGGSTSSFHLIKQGKMPARINQLRMGEIFIQGTGLNVHSQVFQLQAEIIEVKSKPSAPTGDIGLDAFFRKPVFEDRGIRKKALLAVGKQDVDPDHIRPCDSDLEVIGASGDHLILDIESSSKDYRVGDIIDFDLNYVSTLNLMTSEYVHKVMIY